MERGVTRQTATINPLEPTQSAATWQIPVTIPSPEPILDGVAGHQLLAQQVRLEQLALTS